MTIRVDWNLPLHAPLLAPFIGNGKKCAGSLPILQNEELEPQAVVDDSLVVRSPAMSRPLICSKKPAAIDKLGMLIPNERAEFSIASNVSRPIHRTDRQPFCRTAAAASGGNAGGRAVSNDHANSE